jgi:hypothetical protein
MAGNDEDPGRSKRPGAEDRGWPITGWVVGGRAIGRSSDTMYGLHREHEDEEHEFFG